MIEKLDAAFSERFIENMARLYVDGNALDSAITGGGDWGQLLPLIKKHKLLPIVERVCKQSFSENMVDQLSAYKGACSKKRENHIRELKLFLSDCKNVNLDVLVLKGVAYEELIYGCGGSRIYFDNDILIRNEADAFSAHNVLINMGYEPGQNWDPAKKNYEPLKGFHLKYLNGHEYLEYYKIIDGDACVFEIGRTVHTLPWDFTTQCFFSAKEIVSEVGVIKTLSLEKMFLCLIENLFEDACTQYGALFNRLKLRDLVDFQVFLSKYESALDFDLLYSDIIYFRLEKKVIAVCSSSQKFFGTRNRFCEKMISFCEWCQTKFHPLVELQNENALIPSPARYANFLESIKRSANEFCDSIERAESARNQIVELMQLEKVSVKIECLFECDWMDLRYSWSGGDTHNYVFMLCFFVPTSISGSSFVFAICDPTTASVSVKISESFLSTGALQSYRIQHMDVLESNTGSVEVRFDYSTLGCLHEMVKTKRVVLYSAHIHERVVSNVFYHVYGDDENVLFRQKLIRIAPAAAAAAAARHRYAPGMDETPTSLDLG